MKAKVLALIILIGILGIPFIVYYFLIVRSQAKIYIIGQGVYQVALEGSFGYSLLPLADTLLKKTINCVDICDISPLPQSLYQVTIVQTGSIDTTTTIDLTDTLEARYEYIPKKALGIRRDIQKIQLPDETEEYTYLTSLRNGSFVVLKKGPSPTLGFLVGEVFESLRDISSDTEVSVDRSGNFLIVSGIDQYILVSKDFMHEKILPNTGEVPVNIDFYEGIWKIQTASTVYEVSGTDIRENIRFSDFIDISQTKRVGYIRPDDYKKLALGNFASGRGVLIMLDRSNGESYTLQENVSIASLIRTETGIGTIDEQGKMVLIDIE